VVAAAPLPQSFAPSSIRMPFMTNKKNHSYSELYRRLLLEVKPYGLHLLGILFVTLLSIPLSLLTPLSLKIAVDSVIGSHPLPTFVQEVLPTALAHSCDVILMFIIVSTIVIAAP